MKVHFFIPQKPDWRSQRTKKAVYMTACSKGSNYFVHSCYPNGPLYKRKKQLKITQNKTELECLSCIEITLKGTYLILK